MLDCFKEISKINLLNFGIGYIAGSSGIFYGKIISLIKGGKASEHFQLANPEMRRKIIVANVLSSFSYKTMYVLLPYEKRGTIADFLFNSARTTIFVAVLYSERNNKIAYNRLKKIIILMTSFFAGCELYKFLKKDDSILRKN